MESSTRTTIDPDLLLAQTEWVQRLARRLVTDEDRARDVAQDAFLAALERPPEKAGNETSLRAWLARVVRSIVHGGARSEARRRVRETSAAPRPPTDSVADTIARASQLQLVVETVMELEEPYRAALLMTYFDGLSAAEAGRRTGASEVAVRKRVSRGLQRLREKLDRLHDGDRTAWVSALVPWLSWHRPVESTATAGGLASVGTKVAAALLAAGGGTFVLHGLGAEPETSPLAYAASADGVRAPDVDRRSVSSRQVRPAGVEPASSHGWLNAATEDGTAAAWWIEDSDLRRPGARTSGVAQATFRLPAGRRLELVVVADGASSVVQLEPFAPGEVRDVVVSLATDETSPASSSPARELAREVGDEPRPERPEGATSSRWLARHVPSSRAADSERRTYAAAPRSTSGRPAVEARADTKVETWTQIGPGFANGAGPGPRGAPLFASIGPASVGGFAWHDPTAGASSPSLATASLRAHGLAGFGALQATSGGLLAMAAPSESDGGESADEGPARIVVLDVTTGWPAYATASFLAPSASGEPVLVAATADGRMGMAAVEGVHAPIVPIRPSAELFVEALVEPLDGARAIVIDVDGVELVRAQPAELARGVRLPRGTARVRVLAADGSTVAARELTLAPGANAVH